MYRVTTASVGSLVALTLLAATVQFASAQALAPITGAECAFLGVGCPGGVENANSGLVRRVAVVVINAFLGLASVTALGFMIWGGVSYVISQGENDRVQKAKLTITYAVIGLVIIGLAAVIVNFVINIFTGGPFLGG